MRKLLFVLMALVIAAPAMAAVTITGTQAVAGDGKLILSYNATGEPNLVRAFALILTVDSTAKITAVTPAKTGESTSAAKGYGIFPGTITIDGTGAVTSYGTPVEPNALPGGPSALNTARVVVALGSLYKGDANKPATSGALFTVTVDKTCNLTVAEEETARGGVVLETAAGTSITGGPFPITVIQSECMKSTNPTEYASWVLYGKPSCWCFKRQCRGDADGAKVGPYSVQTNDLTLFRLALNKNDTLLPGVVSAGKPGICADFDHTKVGPYRVQTNDLTIFRANLNKNDTLVTVCPSTNINFWTN